MLRRQSAECVFGEQLLHQLLERSGKLRITTAGFRQDESPLFDIGLENFLLGCTQAAAPPDDPAMTVDVKHRRLEQHPDFLQDFFLAGTPSWREVVVKA